MSSKCEQKMIHAIQFHIVDVFGSGQLFREKDVPTIFVIRRIPVMSSHLWNIGHSFTFVLLKHPIPQLRIVRIYFLRIVLQQFLFASSKYVMREAQPYFIKRKPMSMVADKEKISVLCGWGMGSDQDIMKTSRFGTDQLSCLQIISTIRNKVQKVPLFVRFGRRKHC